MATRKLALTTAEPPAILIPTGVTGAWRLSSPTEARTRRELIDPALKKAGWDVTNPTQVGLEIPVDDVDPQAWHALQARLSRLRESGVPYDVELPKGVSDYVLYRPDGDIIGVVEAKRTCIDPRLAQAQTEFYVQEIAKRQDSARQGLASCCVMRA